MLYIEKNRIRLTRGDTAILSVSILNATTQEQYRIAEDDVLTLTVKKSVKDEEPLLQKRITGSNTFHINPNDTSSLEFGKYKYDVELTTAKGDVFTVIGPSTFEVLSEVTY